MSNVQKSEVVIARILKLLMERGLSESIMSFNSLELDTEYQPFFKTCFLWLVDEGLVRASHNAESITSAFHAYNPVLTAKGFSLLGRRLGSKDGEVTLAVAIDKTAMENGYMSGIGDFLGSFVGGAYKSINGG